ncbi:MAG: hypothetical protein WAK40_03025 [Thermoplasmata archaeon]
MPLVLDPAAVPAATLAELRRSLREDLGETRSLVDAPGARVVDPLSLVTARDLLESALALLDAPGDRDPRRAADEANLAYATLLAVIDLVKSHTELPRVPRGKGTG